MPYSDPDEQRAYQQHYYQQRKQEYLARQRARRTTPEGRAKAKLQMQGYRRTLRCYICRRPAAGGKWAGHFFGLCGEEPCVSVNRWWSDHRWHTRLKMRDPELLGLDVLARYLIDVSKAVRKKHPRPA